MAKKVRRARRRRTKPKTEQAPEIVQDKPKLTDEEELRSEYAYVLKDLRRIFILGGAMFLLLILLNILLQSS